MFRTLLELQYETKQKSINDGTLDGVKDENTYAVFLIAIKCTMQIFKGNIIVFVEPLHNERLKPCRIFRHSAFVWRNIFHIVFIMTLDLDDVNVSEVIN